MKWIISLVVVAAAVYLFVQAQVPAHDAHTIAQMQQNPYNRQAIDKAISMVHTGDIIVRTGNDMTSYMFCRANRRDHTYSHCGIVSVENGYPFVYHSIGGEDNPDEVLRRDSLNFWLSPVHNTGFGIRRTLFNPAQIDAMLQVAQSYYRQQKKFDLDFDIQNDDKLYCAELLYRAMNRAAADSNYIRPTHSAGYTYVAVDNITAAPGSWVWQITYK